jgi:hypothetical protein
MSLVRVLFTANASKLITHFSLLPIRPLTHSLSQSVSHPSIHFCFSVCPSVALSACIYLSSQLIISVEWNCG